MASNPYYDASVVYVAQGTSLHAVDAQAGTRKWVHATNGALQTGSTSGPVVAQGVAYVCGFDNSFRSGGNKLYAIEASSGERLWSCSIGPAMGCSRPAVAGDVVFVGSSDFKVHAIDANGYSGARVVVSARATTRPYPNFPPNPDPNPEGVRH